MFMPNIYTMKKKVIPSLSSRFNSDQICMFLYLWAVSLGVLNRPDWGLPRYFSCLFQKHSSINIHSNCCSFGLWMYPQVLQKLGKTMETKDEQFELCSQNLIKQQVPQHLSPHKALLRVKTFTWTSGNINFQKMEDLVFCGDTSYVFSIITFRPLEVQGCTFPFEMEDCWEETGRKLTL